MEQALIVQRWCRYGADRLYVTAGSGTPLGSVDLVTGQVAVEAGIGESGTPAGLGESGGLAGLGESGGLAGPGESGGPGVDPRSVLEEAVLGAAQAYLRIEQPELVVPTLALRSGRASAHALAPGGETGHLRGPHT